MEKFYFNKQKHVYERKNIPTFKEWCLLHNLDIPEKQSEKEKDLMEKYEADMQRQFPTDHCMKQDIRVLQFEEKNVVLEVYVDEEEGIVHLIDLCMDEETHLADIVEERLFQHLYDEDPSVFQKESIYDYRFFIYSKDGIVSEWRHDKLWFEGHFDVKLKR